MTVDQLVDLGVRWMDDSDIRDFLASQGVGVLGLEEADGPYLLPMSFGYDGESTLYFTMLVGSESRKEAAIERTDTARFLVYDASSAFVWESVLLSGPLEAVSESRLDVVDEATDNAWRPAVLEEAAGSGMDVLAYAMRITEQTGIKHTGLPEGFRTTEE